MPRFTFVRALYDECNPGFAGTDSGSYRQPSLLSIGFEQIQQRARRVLRVLGQCVHRYLTGFGAGFRFCTSGSEIAQGALPPVSEHSRSRFANRGEHSGVGPGLAAYRTKGK